MKTTKTGFAHSLGIISVLLMLTGSSMTARIGNALSVPYMKQWVYADTLRLSKLVGGTQADFAQDRLGDKYYDGYIPRISGLPNPTWHLDQKSEEEFLKMIVAELSVFKGFIVEMENHESQNKSSQFTARFQKIEDEINRVISSIEDIQIVLGYGIAQQSGSPHTTRKPATTQKEQDEWELGIQKGFLMWLIPVQAKFHRELSTTT